MKERELEDRLVANPDIIDPWNTGNPVTLLGRQLCLTHGILDLLAYQDAHISPDPTYAPVHAVYLVELKAGALSEAHVGQVLRYASDLREVLVQAVGRSVEHPPVGTRGYALWTWACSEIIGADGSDNVYPVLIGRSVNDKVLAACDGAGIAVGLYAYDGEHLAVSWCHYAPDVQAAADTAQCPWARRLGKRYGSLVHHLFRASSETED